MCGLFVTSKKCVNAENIGKFLHLRGPDHTEIVNQYGLTFVHFLLSITGNKVIQPITNGHATALANGEIYNHDVFGTFASDCECIIPVFNEFGNTFPQHLDGEFAIVIVDWESRKIIMSTDTFATKPLYYSIESGEFGIASYPSSLIAAGFTSPIKVPANTILELNLNTLAIQLIGAVTTFSLTQSVTDVTRWQEAFEAAVLKRTSQLSKPFFVGLSSGFDSGAICTALNNNELSYNAYTVLGKESRVIIDSRVALMPTPSFHLSIAPTKEIIADAVAHLNKNVESVYYTAHSADGKFDERNMLIHNDDGAVRMAMMCRQAQIDGKKVYLSGHGADEIISDYGVNGIKLLPRSNFGGKFPNDLASIFPWPSFYGSSQESYLMKEEHVAGSFGLETRYPFLDKLVVQEFLSLSAKIKNSCYKSVINHYLKKHNYPNVYDKKIGF